jgi:hydrogenase expression/formation protein HypC
MTGVAGTSRVQSELSTVQEVPVCLAVPGRVLAIADGELRMARIAFGEVVKEASLNLVPAAEVGSYVLVHAGMALEVVDEAAAQETLRLFAELAEIERQMDAP